MPDQNPSSNQERETDSSGKLPEFGGVQNKKETKEAAPTTGEKKTSSDKFLRGASFIVDVLVFIAVGSYTIVAWNQWTEMKLDRRAWVAVNTIRGIPEAGKPFIVTVVVTNTGKTFAKDLEMVATGETVQNDETPDFAGGIREAARRRSPEAISHVLLAPNAISDQTLESQDTPSFSETQIAGIKNGNPRFFVYGQMTYRDIFEHQHWLTFCAVLNFNPRQTEGAQWTYLYYKKYNDTGKGQPPWQYSTVSRHSSGGGGGGFGTGARRKNNPYLMPLSRARVEMIPKVPRLPMRARGRS